MSYVGESYVGGVYYGGEGAALPSVSLASATTNADGTEIHLTFSENMADPAGEHGAFSFEEDATGRSFSAAALAAGDATTIVLTVDGAAIERFTDLTTSYDAGTGSVQSAAGVDLESFTDEPVVNAICPADFCTNFSEHATGAGLPTGWEHQWNTSATFTVEEEASLGGTGARGGKLLRQTNSPDNAHKFVKWTDVSTGRHVIRARVWLDNNTGLGSTRRKCGLVIFGSGDTAGRTGYVLDARVHGVSGSPTDWWITHLKDGSVVSEATDPDGVASSNWSVNAWNWMELLYNPELSRIEARFWNDGGSRPETPNGTLAVAEPLDSGGVGIHTWPGSNATGLRWDVIEVDVDIQPLPPTLEGSAPDTTAFLATDGFQPGATGMVHHSTEWMIRPAGALDWEPGTLVGYLLSETDLTVAVIEDLPPETDLEARARHIGELDETEYESGWSNTIEFTTSEEVTRPDTPVLTVDDVGLDYVQTSRGAYSHPEGTQDPPDGTEEDPDDILPWHLASQYEVRDRGTLTVVLDTGLTSERVDLVQLFDEVGDPGDELEIRVRDQDGKYGVTSEYSAWVPFDLLTLDAFRPEQPTITVDVCDPEGIQVSGDAYVSGDSPASAHVATRWWIGVGPAANIEWRSVITEDPAKLTAFTWPWPPPALYRLAVSYQDEDGRWSDRSAHESCQIDPPPPQPFITEPACSGLVDDDLPIEWDMLGGDPADYEFRGEIAGPLPTSGVPDSWDELFGRQAGTSHTLVIDGLVDGDYLVRIQACELSDGPCGEWAYLAVTIDRSGEATLSVPYNFPELSSLPGTWDLGWDQGAIWELVNKTLGTSPPFVGILARNPDHNTMRTSVLRFNELGEPTDMDATIIMAWVPRDTTWYGWRFAYTQYLHGGLGWRILNADESPGSLNGVVQFAHGGGPLHPFPSGCNDGEAVVCPCGFVTDGVCRGGTALNAIRQLNNPDKLIRYARGGTPGWRLHRQRPGSSVSDILTRSVAVVDDPLREGTIQGRQVPEDPCDRNSLCEFQFVWYVQRYRIRRETSTHTRFQSQVIGPGIDPSQGWQINHLLKTKELGLFKDDQIECGPCGLSFRHLQNLTKDHGILFRCARFTIYDEVAGSGPVLGEASLVL